MSNLTAPNWLTPEAKTIFRDIVKLMSGNSLFIGVDVYALAMLADNMDTYQQASHLIAKEGLIMDGERGNKVKHAAITIRTSSFNSISTLLSQLGMSPTARKTLDLNPVEETGVNSLLAQFTK